MIEEMVATICKSRRLPPDEVKEWYWSRLLRTYRMVGKSLWDEWVSDVQKSEIGVIRAISASFGGNKKLPEMPKYDDSNDPFAGPKPKKKLSDRWRKYYEANNLPIPPEYD